MPNRVLILICMECRSWRRGHDREVCSATGGYHPTLRGFPDLRRRGYCSRPGVGIRCPSYSQAVKWARLERKSYKILESITGFPDNEEPDDVPLFCARIEIETAADLSGDCLRPHGAL